MHPLISLSLLALAPSALAQVNFTLPEVGKPINLNSEAITIAWTVEPASQEARDYEFVDIWWHTAAFAYGLKENFTHAAGTNEFVWNATDVRNALLSNNNTIVGGISWFRLRFHEERGRGSSIDSQNYTVEGYPFVGTGSAGSKVQVGWGIGLMAGAAFLLL
ncbi:hypothetical protein OQA88_857 [Cercophora sp. LCS_1]